MSCTWQTGLIITKSLIIPREFFIDSTLDGEWVFAVGEVGHLSSTSFVGIKTFISKMASWGNFVLSNSFKHHFVYICRTSSMSYSIYTVFNQISLNEMLRRQELIHISYIMFVSIASLLRSWFIAAKKKPNWYGDVWFTYFRRPYQFLLLTSCFFSFMLVRSDIPLLYRMIVTSLSNTIFSSISQFECVVIFILTKQRTFQHFDRSGCGFNARIDFENKIGLRNSHWDG